MAALLLFIGAVFGAALGGFLRSKLHACPDLTDLSSVSLLPRGERFSVIFSSDDGAAARRLYEVADGAGRGVIEFYDGEQLRGRK